MRLDVTSIDDSHQPLTDDACGNITEFKLGARVDSIRAYDPQRGWLKSIVSTKVRNSASLQDLSYVFDAIGNLSHRGDHELGTTPLTEDSIYDNLDRLISSTVRQSGTGGWNSTVTVGYDLTGLGNIKSKSDVGTYTYAQKPSGCTVFAGKHAVTTIAGTKNATYCYDLNGNMVSGDGRSIAYTSYDLPQTITRGFSTVTFSYGPERERYKRVDSTSAGVTTTIYAADRSYEKITRPDGSTAHKIYIGGFAVITRTGSAPYTDTTNFLLGDHLGSTDTITNANGVLVQKMSFDAWGKRRESNWIAMSDPSLFDSTLTTHGFTGHEEIDPVGLIHMNGRVYDPEIGRFLSADPFVQDLSNSQSLNRYSYVLNNPLSLTDPTGFFFGSIFHAIGNFFGKIFSGIFSALKSVLKIPLIRGIIQIAACMGSGPIGIGVCVASAGALSALAGGSLTDAIQAMAFAGAQMAAWWGTGEIIARSMLSGAAHFLLSTGLHGVVGGALSLMQGGSFVSGAAAGAFTETAQSFFGGLPKGPDIVASAVIGGTASVLTGGKFVNGAITGAFATMYNDYLHDDRSYTGVAKGSFPDWWDPIVDRAVGAYNLSNGFSLGDTEYLDPTLIKAQIRVESGTNMTAYMNDPVQVNVPGDWVPEKARLLGLTNGVAPGPVLGIDAGIKWLLYKGYIHDATGTAVSFRGWDAAITRYNGGGDPNYLSKVETQLRNLSCAQPPC